MAKNKGQVAPAPFVPVSSQAPQAAKIDDNLLADIFDSSKLADSYQFVSHDEAGPLVQAEYIVTNPGITDGSGKIAARITDKGTQYLRENAPGLIEDEQKKVETVNTQSETKPAVPAKREKPTISAIVPFDLPQAGKRGGVRTETYPFSQLEVGQAFFIPATEKVPDPVKSFNATVVSATNRYAEQIEGTRTTRKGNEVPNVKLTRVFAIRHCADGAPFGFPGQRGAAVGRTQ